MSKLKEIDRKRILLNRLIKTLHRFGDKPNEPELMGRVRASNQELKFVLRNDIEGCVVGNIADHNLELISGAIDSVFFDVEIAQSNKIALEVK